ncbi:uncharacterized protein LOC115068179 [Nannospalax galili]|uniref:uncharacterized protein LOC115068179 n=1 Tax=Nannospalax galili TaxID=1026970 RepID=UPI00111C4CF9|nr:uncharacterized protein LOC115068179 [Nannospalax galili]
MAGFLSPVLGCASCPSSFLGRVESSALPSAARSSSRPGPPSLARGIGGRASRMRRRCCGPRGAGGWEWQAFFPPCWAALPALPPSSAVWKARLSPSPDLRGVPGHPASLIPERGDAAPPAHAPRGTRGQDAPRKFDFRVRGSPPTCGRLSSFLLFETCLSCDGEDSGMCSGCLLFLWPTCILHPLCLRSTGFLRIQSNDTSGELNAGSRHKSFICPPHL